MANNASWYATERIKGALAGGDLGVAAMFLVVWLSPGLLGAAWPAAESDLTAAARHLP
jgi:hypothetical protein